METRWALPIAVFALAATLAQVAFYLRDRPIELLVLEKSIDAMREEEIARAFEYLEKPVANKVRIASAMETIHRNGASL